MGSWKSSCAKICNANTALLILRIAVGIIFIMHGYGKLFGGAPGMEAFTGMVAKIGFPMPVFFAYAAALSEFFGGIAILLGVFTNVATILVSIVMLVVLVALKKFQFPSSDLEFSLLCMALAIHFAGPGKYAVMKRHMHGDDCCKEKK